MHHTALRFETTHFIIPLALSAQEQHPGVSKRFHASGTRNRNKVIGNTMSVYLHDRVTTQTVGGSLPGHIEELSGRWRSTQMVLPKNRPTSPEVIGGARSSRAAVLVCHLNFSSTSPWLGVHVSCCGVLVRWLRCHLLERLQASDDCQLIGWTQTTTAICALK